MQANHHEHVRNLQANAARTRSFLSNKMKPERERSVCRAFLRTLGVPFDEVELIAPTVEPSDVAFRQARFQVCELIGDRKRGDVWQDKEEGYAEATSLDHVKQPYSPPSPVGLDTLVPDVVEALSKKAKKYGTGCKALDALIYVDLKDKFLRPNSPLPDTGALGLQGWRSVSMLFPPYGIVLIAATEAPRFLQDAAHNVEMSQWPKILRLFEA